MTDSAWRALVLSVGALCGAATMTVELAAVRLLAPWFGTSTTVWTNVIGVILLALALGYALGSRLSARPNPARDLALLLAGASAWAAWLPALARPLCEALLPSDLALDQAAGLTAWGSLAATLCLFLPPAALLGAASPLCTESLQRSTRAHAGSAGGAVMCASTLGSLVGTFATTHVLTPQLGLSWTFLVAALALLVASLALLAARPRGLLSVAVIGLGAGVAAALYGSRVERSALPEGVSELAQAESSYQSLRVVEDRRWGEPQRLLQVNEGLDSFQSVWVAREGLLGPGFYYDLFALPAWWSGEAGPWRVAVIGLGAGTAFRVLRGASPPQAQLELSGVEIDPQVLELGRRWFELPEGSGTVLGGVDGRAGLRVLPGPFELVVLDAYQNQVEIPAHLATFEALREARDKLADGGWIAINVGGFGFDDPVVEALGLTLAAAFDGECVGYLTPRSRNVLLYARVGARVPTPESADFWFEGPVGAALLSALSPRPCWRRYTCAPQDAPLRDEHCPIEHLQQRSLEEARERLARR